MSLPALRSSSAGVIWSAIAWYLLGDVPDSRFKLHFGGTQRGDCAHQCRPAAITAGRLTGCCGVLGGFPGGPRRPASADADDLDAELVGHVPGLGRQQNRDAIVVVSHRPLPWLVA